MSVITVADITYLPYAGSPDPGLPSRVWAVMVTSVGDASGGTNLAQVNLKSAGVPPGNLFSLEQISVEDTDPTHTAVRISADGMQTFPPDNLSQKWVEFFTDTDEGGDTLLSVERSQPRVWLGRGGADVAGTLGFRTLNDTNEELRVTAMGYVWTTGAVNIEGGPRRPASGVFPN